MFVAFIILIAVILRLIPLLGQNFWLDEAFSFHFASNFSFKELFFQSADPTHPSLYYIVLKYWIKFFGVHSIDLRWPSLIFSILSMLFVYKIGKLLDEKLARVYLLVFALSAFQIHYSWQARMYSLGILLTTSSLYFFVKLFFSLQDKNDLNLKHILLLLLINFLGLSNLYGFFIYLGILLFCFAVFFIKKRKAISLYANVFWKIFLFFFGHLFILYLTFYQYFLPTRYLSLFSFAWIKKPSLISFLSLITNLANLNADVFISTFPLSFSLLCQFCLLLFILIFGSRIFLIKLRFLNRIFIFIFCSSIAFILAFSLLTKYSIFLPRFIFFDNIILNCLLANLLYIAFYKKNKKPKFTRPVFVVLLAVFIFNFYSNIIYNYNFDFYLKDNYKNLVNKLKQCYREGEDIIVLPFYNKTLFNYYWQHLPPEKNNPALTFDEWLMTDRKQKSIYISKSAEASMPEEKIKREVRTQMQTMERTCRRRLTILAETEDNQLLYCSIE